MKAEARRALCTLLPLPAVWYLLALLLDNELLLPMPHTVVVRLCALVTTGELWLALCSSGARILGGFLLALLLAGALSGLSARFSAAEWVLSPFMRLAGVVPVASFIVLALLWFSSRYLSLFISFLMVLPVLYTNLLQGFRTADRSLSEMARVFSVTPWRRLRYITLPALRAPLLSGCRVGLGLCWKAGVAAEVIGVVGHSLGGAVYNAKVMLETADLFAWTTVIVLVSAGLERLGLRALEKLLDRGEGRT